MIRGQTIQSDLNEINFRVQGRDIFDAQRSV